LDALSFISLASLPVMSCWLLLPPHCGDMTATSLIPVPHHRELPFSLCRALNGLSGEGSTLHQSLRQGQGHATLDVDKWSHMSAMLPREGTPLVPTISVQWAQENGTNCWTRI
jgi:hypothetical protein